MASPLLIPKQWRVLEWFCKEVAKAVFLESLAVAFIPELIQDVQPDVWLILLGLLSSLTLLGLSVMLAKKGESWT